MPNATSEKVCNRLMGTRLKKKIKKIGKYCKREDCIKRDSQNNDLRNSTLWKCQKNGKICFTYAFIEGRIIIYIQNKEQK